MIFSRARGPWTAGFTEAFVRGRIGMIISSIILEHRWTAIASAVVSGMDWLRRGSIDGYFDIWSGQIVFNINVERRFTTVHEHRRGDRRRSRGWARVPVPLIPHYAWLARR